MKQFYLSGMFVVTALLTACSDEEKLAQTPHEGILRATVESNGPSSRAGFTTDQAAFYWSAGDQIGVTTSESGDAFSALCLAEGSGGQSSGDFKSEGIYGSPEGYAVYPYNDRHSIQRQSATLAYCFVGEYTYNHVDADYATEKQGKGNSFNPAMWGQISNGNVSFKHLGGVFCIKLSKLPVGENLKLVLQSDKKISGSYDVVLKEGCEIVAIDAAENTEEGIVTIAFSNNNENTPGVFYIPAPKGTHNLRLKVLQGETEYVNTVIGTCIIQRRLLKKLELNTASITGGEAQKTETANEVKELLASHNYVVVEDISAGNNEVEIPAVQEDNGSKTVAFEKVDSDLTVKDGSVGENSVDRIYLSFAGNEGGETFHDLTVDTKNSTTTLQAVGTYKIKTATVATGDYTLVVDKGVSIEKLVVVKGNIRVNAGAEIKELAKDVADVPVVYIIREEGASVPASLPAGFQEMSVAEYELRKTGALGGNVALTADITLDRPFVVEKEMTLHLNGHHIRPKAEGLTKVLNTKDGVILVRRGATLTIEGDGSIESNENVLTVIKLTDSNDEKGDYAEQPAKLVVKGGTISGHTFAISGNGTRDNTELTISGGTISSATDYAIYSPQNGTTTITGGTITGAAGAIAIQEGRLDISGTANLKSLGTASYVDEDGDGTRRLQCAVVCVPARYGECQVNLSGGNFVAAGDSKVIDQTYNQTETSNNKAIKISGGTFSEPGILPYLTDNANVNIQLIKDCSLSEFGVEGKNKQVMVDLDSHELGVTNGGIDTITATVTFKNGLIKMTDSEHRFLCMSGTLTLDHVKVSGANYAFWVQGPNAVLNVENQSEIQANYFPLSTNASVNPDGSLTYGQNATINLKDSKFIGTETGFMNNVPAEVTIDNCEFSGNHQAAFLRGGDYVIRNSTFTLLANLDKSHSENKHFETWESGNKAAFSGITIGNYQSTAYQYYTKVEMTGVTVKVEGANASSFPAMHVCANAAEDKGVILTYDDGSKFESAYEPVIEYGYDQYSRKRKKRS